MFLFRYDINDPSSIHKLKYLRFTFLTCLSVVVIYFVRFNLEYKIHSLNWFFLLCIFGLLSSPIIYRKTKNFELSTVATVIPAITSLLVLVWLSGGLDAPGAIWIATIPLTIAILLGVRISLMSLVVVGVFVSASYIASKIGVQINLLKNLADFEFERMFNFILFNAYTAGTSIYYVRSETELKKKLNLQKEEIDGLLKILIHDVGTPLTAMDLTLSAIKTDQNTHLDKQKKSISHSIKSIKTLLNQVRKMRAAKDGKIVIDLRPTDISKVITDLKSELELYLNQKNITLVEEFKHNNHPILGDGEILQHVILMNLLTNAIKFSHTGGAIEIKTALTHDQVIIEVRDYGIGMPENIQKHVFKHSKVTTRKGTSGEKGTGYGLPLAFDYTKKLGGELTIKSLEIDSDNFKRGTSFRLSFKRANPSNLYSE